jgi:hypothetical protein
MPAFLNKNAYILIILEHFMPMAMPMLSGVGFPMHYDLYEVHCTSPIEFSNQPPYPLSTGAILAPPSREQWYLLLAHFCLR